MSELTKHKKLEVFSLEQHDAINEFIEFADTNERIAEVPLQEIFYEMLQIDKKKLEQERRFLLEALREKE